MRLIRDNSFSIIIDANPINTSNDYIAEKDKEKNASNDEDALFSFNKSNRALNCINNNDKMNSNTNIKSDYSLFHLQRSTTNNNDQENGGNQRITNEDIMNIFGMNDDDLSQKKYKEEQEESYDDDKLSL